MTIIRAGDNGVTEVPRSHTDAGITNEVMERPRNLTVIISDKITKSDEKYESLFPSALIYKVPKDLRKLNESAYTPRLIAIGPLHRDDRHLPNTMQHIKMHYADCLFSRVAEEIEDQGEGEKKYMVLKKCVEKMRMRDFVDRAKKYYAEEVNVKDDDMAEMMLIDGCFIIELLYASYEDYHDKKNKEAEKSTTKGGDSGNSKASISSALQSVNEGEYGSSGGGEQRNWDPIFDTILTPNIVKHDLLLLENQIPFFVLVELFKLTVDKISADKIPGGKKLSLTEYVVWYFCNIISPEGENSGSEMKTSSFLPSDCVIQVCGSTNECEQVKKASRKAEYYHILHLLHDYYVPGDQEANSTSSSPCRCTFPGCCSPCHFTIACCCCSPWRCTIGCETTPKKFSELEIRATDLDYAGVKFVPVDIKGNINLFDVKFKEPNHLSWWFHRARFEIPTLHVHDPTETFLRNLIALEQCCPEVSLYFTSYAKLMEMLINSKEDVHVLRKAKVIRNYLGSDTDVSDLFNKLCKEVVIGEFYFNAKCQDAYRYSIHWWPKCMAYLRRTYFASPWAFIGFCLALIAFGVQITNFVRSFLK